jgi:hypothetical protein
MKHTPVMLTVCTGEVRKEKSEVPSTGKVMVEIQGKYIPFKPVSRLCLEINRCQEE